MSSAPTYDQSVIKHYADLWQRMTILPSRAAAVQSVAHRIIGYKDRYRKLELSTGIPWFFIGALHYREADCNFHAHLHNGDPLTKRTVQVPAGRPKAPSEPPFTWDESALDALTMRGLENVHQWVLERLAYEAEGYNGWGYWAKTDPKTGSRVTSAYLWAGTTDHELGKYTSDHHYDPTAKDQEIGVMPLLQAIAALDPSVVLKSYPQGSPVVSPLAPPATQVASTQGPSPEPPQPMSPKADPEARPMTPWATAVGVLTSLASSLGAAVDSLKPILADPKVVAVMVAVALVACGAVLWEHMRAKA